MKIVALTLLAAGLAVAADSQVDLYTPANLKTKTETLGKKRTQFSSETLQRYGKTHYTMVAHREATGSAEVHEKESDIFYALSGDAQIVTGGTLVSTRTEKPGELRGTSIAGGKTEALPEGSIIHIPAGVPHQLLIEKGKQFTYFVVKVIEQ
jgi:mannose-6-phosphate isomerase-like protein (cupin superfamily)